MSAKSFKDTKGKAQKSAENYKYVDGDNAVRMVGGILPRYQYWLKDSSGKDYSVECLSFDREKERFTNREVDHVPKFYPEVKCAWSYSVNCIDVKTGKLSVLNLKKKLFEQICSAAEDLGDPTDPVTGWDCVFEKKKTGPHAFNVEYTLKVLRCKPRALTETELAAVEVEPTIDTKLPRPTPDEVLAILEARRASSGDEGGVDSEAIDDLSLA